MRKDNLYILANYYASPIVALSGMDGASCSYCSLTIIVSFVFISTVTLAYIPSSGIDETEGEGRCYEIQRL
jgi:hypothetical protein